ncbi:ABC transporter permease [Paludicola sp. MB14-C6]|uniref:ABC transporter permease n=1 Tax=Paludihabitans sp. MB14-C6 TaxID=3070656 RepID=UPI0027DE4CD2|nr:ABC transporter permease [Paludicola sp. MB14-C6]WMJ23910.1 ABC transporter permease [Paludicola sp. MB14-C6]
MREKLKHITKTTGFANFIASLLAIVVGLLFGLIILLISNPGQALSGFMVILKGGFTNGLVGIGEVWYYATPIILTGLSVGFAFKTGLFNIGTPGQFIVGAYAAVYVGVHFTALGPTQWIFALLAGAIAGGIWGILPGILKAYANVNEVISSIMMNYIGMYLVNLLVVRTIFNPLANESVDVNANAVIPKWGLDKIFPYPSVNAGIIIAIIVVIIIHIVLNKTTFGYELKACGHNPHASKYAGINAKRNIVTSMIIAGALSGLGGALLYLAGSGKHLQVLDILAVEGFNGIPVALLGLSNPIGVLVAGLFIAHITVGGINLQFYDFVPEIIDIIIASIIYFSAFSLLFKGFIAKISKNKEDKKAMAAQATNAEKLYTGDVVGAQANGEPPQLDEGGKE